MKKLGCTFKESRRGASQRKDANMFKSTTDRVTYSFTNSSDAWKFMKLCEEVKISAGFPTLRAPYTVTVLVKTWIDREACDAFACGTRGECSGYAFGTGTAVSA